MDMREGEYYQMLMNQYMNNNQQAQELINRIDNDVDLSNATLAPENENENVKNSKKQENVNVIESGEIVIPKKKKTDLSYYCCACCSCCNWISCIFITILLLGILGLMGFLIYPRTATIAVKNVQIQDINDVVRTLQSYNNYHNRIQTYMNYKNLDLTFDFTISLEINSTNYYKYNFTDVDIDLYYPGTRNTPKFQIAKAKKDYIVINEDAVSKVNIPFKASISFNDLLEKGHFYNVFSSCTWDAEIRGLIQVFGIKTNWISLHKTKRFTKTCVVENILTELQRLKRLNKLYV
ncbi:hypothetical protein BCR32DRAFT_264813 [Anaeromyces robustus]|uniref:Late embryogenesis abundant protein LEA-2 subgroup domain-containing protein n=1 Tax=Anaeromyces robustus TaxID=1754192 RepID=A0A1Y1XLS1_9FUNG|nr:hypothetical protein BCR32DRAFT_264813 [Anaeromyces robustus]|eukprot:ORX86653.1 hypothetical protein BCR32DRAFT_264813 [Anaeromyces robustus]